MEEVRNGGRYEGRKVEMKGGEKRGEDVRGEIM